MKKIVMDLDFTISKKVDNYENAVANNEVINQMKKYKELGFWITIFTARNMKTYGGDISKINEHTLPIIISWLDKNDVPYDEVIVGKPWNDEGFYVDDNAVRPSEFTSMTFDEITKMLDKERRKMWK